MDIDYGAEDFAFFVQRVCEPLELTTLKQIIVALNNPRLIRQYIRALIRNERDTHRSSENRSARIS